MSSSTHVRHLPAFVLRAACGLALAAAACGGGGAAATPAPPSTAQAADDAPPAPPTDDAGAASVDAPADPGEGLPAGGELEGKIGASTDPGLRAAEDDREVRCTQVGVALEKKVRPELKACYRDGKKKDPELRGKVRISVNVNTVGKVTSVVAADKTLPDPVVACMLAAVKKTPPTDAASCSGKSIVLPVEFPTPR